MIQGFTESLGYREWFRDSLDPREVELSLMLFREKYSSDAWNLRGEASRLELKVGI
ncbi:MAG: hypothetical protein F7B17_04930 [Desulfurococcales archaeon]|nr:hypothetical protein [Desulfurococcales archaeon]